MSNVLCAYSSDIVTSNHIYIASAFKFLIWVIVRCYGYKPNSSPAVSGSFHQRVHWLRQRWRTVSYATVTTKLHRMRVIATDRVASSIGHESEPCKNARTDRDAVWSGLKWAHRTMYYMGVKVRRIHSLREGWHDGRWCDPSSKFLTTCC